MNQEETEKRKTEEWMTCNSLADPNEVMNGSNWLNYWPLTGFCEHINEPFVAINVGDFLNSQMTVKFSAIILHREVSWCEGYDLPYDAVRM